MRSPELRYVLVHNDGSDGDDDDTAADGGSLVAFTSLMPTYEEGQPVVYCYEVHLQEDLRGCVPLSPGEQLLLLPPHGATG